MERKIIDFDATDIYRGNAITCTKCKGHAIKKKRCKNCYGKGVVPKDLDD